MTSDEFIKKFTETYASDYEYEWDEDLREITVFCNKKTGTVLDCVKISLDADSFNIYREILFEDHYSHSITLEIMKEELLFYECVKRISGQLPQISYEDGMGCPFYCDLIGYFRLPLVWDRFIQLFAIFEQACQQFYSLTINEIDKNSDLLAAYDEMKFKTFEELKGLSSDLCNKKISDIPLNQNHKFDSVFAYVNTDNTILTGVGLEHLMQMEGEPSIEQYHFYMGLKYFIICPEHKSNCIVIVNKKLIDKVVALFEQVNEEWDIDSYIHYSLDQHLRLVVTCGELWAIICPINSDSHEACFTFEKNKIKTLEHDFLQVAPEHLWNRTFDFTKLTDEDFEIMCRDLLYEMGFQNIQVRGKTRTPDNGIDITAEEEYQTLIGTEKRKWIFQCKHTKGQINRKDLSEVRDLLREFNADSYGLFYSGYFSANTLDRMNTLRQNEKIKIHGWDFNGLELLLTKFPKISMKYFGI